MTTTPTLARRALRALPLLLAPVAGISLALGQDAASGTTQAAAAAPAAPAVTARRNTLLDTVQRATGKYINVGNATADDYLPSTPCVSGGPVAGAMGVHFINMTLFKDGQLNAQTPEALIYEPTGPNRFKLVGVEFIVIAKDWVKKHPKDPVPTLEGHLMNYVGAPNRYGLDAFYELHVWAWEHNPNGSFADFNTQVDCDRQPLNGT